MKRRHWTPSKQCIHFFRSDLCPPTSIISKFSWPISKRVSVIPVVRRRACSMSWLLGSHPGSKIRSSELKKLETLARNMVYTGTPAHTNVNCREAQIHGPEKLLFELLHLATSPSSPHELRGLQMLGPVPHPNLRFPEMRRTAKSQKSYQHQPHWAKDDIAMVPGRIGCKARTHPCIFMFIVYIFRVHDFQ